VHLCADVVADRLLAVTLFEWHIIVSSSLCARE
jgi:hypothetical protein